MDEYGGRGFVFVLSERFDGAGDTVGALKDGYGDGLHGVFDVEVALFALLFHGGQVEAVLVGELFEDGNRLQDARDEVGDGVGEEDGQNDRVVAAYFQHHEDGGEGSAQKRREEDSHADERVRADGAREVREVHLLEGAYGCAEHGSDEECGSEHAAGRSAGEGERGGDDFKECEDEEHSPGELRVHGLVDGLVAGAHDLREAEVADGIRREGRRRRAGGVETTGAGCVVWGGGS